MQEIWDLDAGLLMKAQDSFYTPWPVFGEASINTYLLNSFSVPGILCVVTGAQRVVMETAIPPPHAAHIL